MNGITILDTANEKEQSNYSYDLLLRLNHFFIVKGKKILPPPGDSTQSDEQ